MAKKTKVDFPADTWLMVATDALARYAAGGGILWVMTKTAHSGRPTLSIVLDGVTLDDPRIAKAFVDGIHVVLSLGDALPSSMTSGIHEIEV